MASRKNDKTAMITVRLPHALLECMEAMRQPSQWSQSDVVRIALETFLDRESPGPLRLLDEPLAHYQPLRDFVGDVLHEVAAHESFAATVRKVVHEEIERARLRGEIDVG